MAAAVNAEAPSFEAFAEDAEDAEEDAMTAATGADPEEQLESDDEDDDFVPPAHVTEPAPSPVAVAAPAPSPVAVTAPAPSPVPTVELVAEPTVTETTKNGAPIAEINAEQISLMDKKTVQAHCRARSIDIEAKGLVQLKRELTASLK